MKRAMLRAGLVLAAFALTSCQSGDVAKRADYSDPSFNSLSQKISDRAKVLRSLEPNLTEAEAGARAAAEFGPEQAQLAKEQKKKAAQDKFEEDLAKSVGK